MVEVDHECWYLEWADSTGGHGWAPLDDYLGDHPHIIRTCGFKVAETDDYVTIVQSLDLDRREAHADFCLVIPKFAIKVSARLGFV